MANRRIFIRALITAFITGFMYLFYKMLGNLGGSGKNQTGDIGINLDLPDA